MTKKKSWWNKEHKVTGTNLIATIEVIGIMLLGFFLFTLGLVGETEILELNNTTTAIATSAYSTNNVSLGLFFLTMAVLIVCFISLASQLVKIKDHLGIK